MVHGGNEEDVIWPTKNRFSHFPPKSPVPSAGSLNLDSCAGGFFLSNENHKGERQAQNKDAYLPVEPPWLNELLDSPKLSITKFSHRRSASDTMAFHAYPTSLSRIDEAEDEDVLAHTCTRLRCFLDCDHLDEGGSGITHPHLAALESKSKIDQILITQSLHTTQISDLCSLFQRWRLGDSVAKLSTSTGTSLDDGGLGVYRDNAAPLAGWRFVNTGLALNSIKECKTCDDYSNPSSAPLNFVQDSEPQQVRKHSGQRSRVRKLQYIAELESHVNSLQAEVSALAPQVAFLDHQRGILIAENKALKKKLLTLTKDGQYKNAHVEVLRSEVQRCKLLFQQQKKQALPRLHPQAAVSRAYDSDQHIERMKPAVSDTCLKFPLGPHHHGVSYPIEGFVKGKPVIKKNCMPSSCTRAGNGKSWDAQINGGVLLPEFMIRNA
ncbi:hypothetical protein O6H91_08G099500 [Diphasiastrum complanatum]|uniref:Uncharacterized protein n=2 Tax=Diphasiastrum complanatum TaxID=34168 RepID=A0ACC2D0R4_DIPCM|nr:hypothetical protein O6H91_08G099500 [Diphasiastrum complanatum]KAJ7547701.1 hypothetical protein O6H91_08G099500 [Diphasiastrum complanatum]